MKRTIAALALSMLGFGGGCSSDDADLGGNGRQACDQHNWRNPTPGTVVCPGAAGCACAAGEVCCLTGGSTSDVGSCGQLSQCADWAFSCDGPEDCPSGQVCCLYGETAGGAECRDEKDCFFYPQELTMCRGPSDCDGLEECTPSGATSLMHGIVAACVH